jgi:zeaxanthin glucosyltransferase
MARIAILVDGELAHVHPTLLFAKHLVDRGHTVCYLGLGPIKKLVISRGFRFIRIFQEVLTEEMTTAPDGAAVSLLFQSIARGGTLREALDLIKPDVIITLSIFSLIAILIQIAINIPAVLLRTHCTLLPRPQDTRRIVVSSLLQCCGSIGSIGRLFEAAGVTIKEVADLEGLILGLPELILLPREFVLSEQSDGEDGTIYVGAGIQVEYTPTFPWEKLNINGTLIYCSLGSRPDLELDTSRLFFEIVIKVITQHPEFYLVLSTGGNSVLASQLNSSASNVYITSWVPQLEVLGRSGVAITHGGLGTIKECILLGVPMVVFPVMRDQFSGAERISQLGLGVRGEIRSLSGEELLRLIRTVIDNKEHFKDKLSIMQNIFSRSELKQGVQIIEQIATGGQDLRKAPLSRLHL